MEEYQEDCFTTRFVSCLFNSLTGKKIAFLGFALKKDTSDIRGSPAITFVTNFVAEKAQVAIYNPKVKESRNWKELIDAGGKGSYLKQDVFIYKPAYEACRAVDVLIEWDEFSNKALVESAKCPKDNQSQDTNDRDENGLTKEMM